MNVPAAKKATAGTVKKKKKKKPPKIEINTEFCKGCGICVAFCPSEVLVMEKGKAAVANLPACIECMFCELRCPDFAITVTPAGD